jgi:hypothetical protein
MLCYAMPCHAMPCHAMPCHAMPCYAMLCYAMPCHAMLCYGGRRLSPRHGGTRIARRPVTRSLAKVLKVLMRIA